MILDLWWILDILDGNVAEKEGELVWCSGWLVGIGEESEWKLKWWEQHDTFDQQVVLKVLLPDILWGFWRRGRLFPYEIKKRSSQADEYPIIWLCCLRRWLSSPGNPNHLSLTLSPSLLPQFWFVFIVDGSLSVLALNLASHQFQ